MNILFTICGRAGSKGAKNKNIRNFLGLPLPLYTLSIIDLFLNQNAASFKRADIAISTDSEILLKIFENQKRPIHLVNRDKELASDMIRKYPDVVRNCMEIMEERLQVHYDVVVDLDITSPLRRRIDLENVISKRMEVDAEVVFTVTEARRNPYFNMVAKQGDYFKTVLPCPYTTRQEAPAVYDMNASIYAFEDEFIHSNKPVFTKSDIVLMKDSGFLDIDSEWDFEMMEVVAQAFYKKYDDYAEVFQNITNLI